MPEITIRLHPDLAEKLLAAGPEGARSLSSLWRQVDRRGPLARAAHCLCAGRPARRSPLAMSVHVGLRGMVVEVDRPATRSRAVAWSPSATKRSAARRAAALRGRGGTIPAPFRLLQTLSVGARRRENSSSSMFPMPRRKIQRAFLSWLEENRDRLRARHPPRASEPTGFKNFPSPGSTRRSSAR